MLPSSVEWEIQKQLKHFPFLVIAIFYNTHIHFTGGREKVFLIVTILFAVPRTVYAV